MSIRYLIRRPNPAELADIKAEITNLDEKLGKADANYRKTMLREFNAVRSAQYYFSTKKSESGWNWICTSVELSAESEDALLSLCDKYRAPRPTHITNVISP